MYDYKTMKPKLFTEEGQVAFLKARDHVEMMIEAAGAFTMGRALIGGGDTWEMMARIDRLVELGEIYEVTGPKVAGQDRIFTRRR